MIRENFKALVAHNSPHHFYLWALKVQVTKDDSGKTVIISFLFFRQTNLCREAHSDTGKMSCNGNMSSKDDECM